MGPLLNILEEWAQNDFLIFCAQCNLISDMLYIKKKVTWKIGVIKEKYIQLCLALQFGGINTIDFIQSLCLIKKA